MYWFLFVLYLGFHCKGLLSMGFPLFNKPLCTRRDRSIIEDHRQLIILELVVKFQHRAVEEL